MLPSKSEGPAVRNHFKARVTPNTRAWQACGCLRTISWLAIKLWPGMAPANKRWLSLAERKLRTMSTSPFFSSKVITGSGMHKASTVPLRSAKMAWLAWPMATWLMLLGLSPANTMA